MASSFTTSYGIEKIGSGEQSGTWGTTTNHNLDLLDRIAAYTSVALSGTTHTLTVREASPDSGTENLQDGMYRVIKFTGALAANNTVTIAPNTTKAYFIVENATTDSGSSGPYSVILSQGSGANVTLQNGKNAIIYCDGAGSGAIVYNGLADAQFTTLEVTDAAAIDGAVTISTTTSGTGTGAKNKITLQGITGSDIPNGLVQWVSVDNGESGARWGLYANAVTAGDFILGYAASGTFASVVEFQTSKDAWFKGNITSTGTVEPAGDTSTGDTAAIGWTSAEGLILTGQGSTSDITLKNDADGTVFTVPTGTDDILFPDNAKAMWGTGSDLSMHHNGSYGYIQNSTGTMHVGSDALNLTNQAVNETYVACVNGAAVSLYHDNSVKFATSSTGVTITGAVTATTVAGGMLASKAEMEAASATDHVVSPGLMNDHPGMLKCWVSFNQVTPAILAEHNSSSVTDSATGRSTTVWDTDFSAATYATGGTALATVANHGVELIAGSKASGGCGYACKNFAGNLDGDTTDLNIWAAGDQ